ncbi:PREDICTED: pre-B-cell leukemia transcription factor 3-like [Thamnophis sirtalis]|uniref:Pre-B-cell leukemia transcription factor 3-like n=1 Tax=Thamnophis sirtalis TaxID=35019 RepID=A0A6I9X7U0_9SAUR|nr:PREDICTED: pre-B-cell leukemia transcription factor 3-like [Thamnophis sirtalis]
MEEASRLLAGLAPPPGAAGDPSPHRLQAPPGPPQPQGAPGLQDTGDILQQIMAITDQSLDEAQARKHALNCHRMKPALFSVLCDIKEKTVTMIIAGDAFYAVSGIKSFSSLSKLRAEGNDMYGILKGEVDELDLYLMLQSIDEERGENLAEIMRVSLAEAPVITKGKLMKGIDGEFRVFIKYAMNNKLQREVHIRHVKKTLRIQILTGIIIVLQVSNWFGNKRIRYKKNMGKFQEEANIYAAKTAVDATNVVAQGNQTSSPPTPNSGSSGSFKMTNSGDSFINLQSLSSYQNSPVGANVQSQMDSLHHVIHQAGRYDSIVGNPLYSTQRIDANGSWQDATTPSSITSPTGDPGSINSDASN